MQLILQTVIRKFDKSNNMVGWFACADCNIYSLSMFLEMFSFHCMICKNVSANERKIRFMEENYIDDAAA